VNAPKAPPTPQERAQAALEAAMGIATPEFVPGLAEAFQAVRSEARDFYRATIRELLVRLGGAPGGPCPDCRIELVWFALGSAGNTERVAVDPDGRVHLHGYVRGRLSPCPRRK
jgi:hypothetical protein